MNRSVEEANAWIDLLQAAHAHADERHPDPVEARDQQLDEAALAYAGAKTEGLHILVHDPALAALLTEVMRFLGRWPDWRNDDSPFWEVAPPLLGALRTFTAQHPDLWRSLYVASQPQGGAVHLLHEGVSLCDISGIFGVPGQWPEGHRWISAASAASPPPDAVICEGCFHIYSANSANGRKGFLSRKPTSGT